MTSIDSVGIHVPRYRISAEEIQSGMGQFNADGVTEKAVAGPDEDSLTMGIEAAKLAIDDSSINRKNLTALTVGTTTPPLEENALGAQVVEMLGLQRSVETTVITQSTAAGAEAFRVAMQLRDGPALAIATDTPSGNPDEATGQGAGAGAVAMLLADEGEANITDVSSYSKEFPGTRFRERGAKNVQTYGANSYERQAFAEIIAGALDGVSSSPSGIAPSASDGTMPYRSTNEIEDDPTVYERASSLGDTGAASPFFGLLEAWDSGESTVHVVGYGGGATATAIVIDGSLPVPATKTTVDITYSEYLRYRGHILTNGGEK